MTWRSVVSGLVVTTLMVAPAAAVVCATYCVDQSVAHATTHGAAGHHHTGHASPEGHARLSAAPHACDGHAGITTPATRLHRQTRVTAGAPSVSPGPALATARLAPPRPALLTDETHGPPGHGAVTTVPVLRI